MWFSLWGHVFDVRSSGKVIRGCRGGTPARATHGRLIRLDCRTERHRRDATSPSRCSSRPSCPNRSARSRLPDSDSEWHSLPRRPSVHRYPALIGPPFRASPDATSRAQQIRVAESRLGARSPRSIIASPVTDRSAISDNCCCVTPAASRARRQLSEKLSFAYLDIPSSHRWVARWGSIRPAVAGGTMASACWSYCSAR